MHMSHLLLAGAMLAGGAPAQAAPPEGQLTIEASGFRHARGQAVVKLFAPGDNVLGPGRWQASAAITGGVSTLQFDKLPAGRYAAVLFHDENANGVLDHGLLGPAEPLAYSGGFSLGLLSGLPSFEKLQFELLPAEQHMALRLP